MRKIAATYIYPVSSPPLKKGILIINDNGTIVDLIDTKGDLKEQEGLEYYNGIIVPGFINAHCHLELSHLKSKIDKGTGLGNFIGAINKIRIAGEQEIIDAAIKADRLMQKNGIVAVGDISNSLESLSVKKSSQLNYHTFVEVFGLKSERANRAFDYAEKVFGEFKKNEMAASIVPHSPYSVSKQLFELIKNHAEAHHTILSIHNQESLDENEFYQTGKGGIANHLKNNIGLDISDWNPTGRNSLPSILKKLPAKNKMLLVHNTFTSKEDLTALKEYRPVDDIFFVLCPNANLYINNTLPPVNLFRGQNLNVCFGTDSFASNSGLSVLSEMLTIQNNFKVNFEELISWATLNGAKALAMDKQLGSFDIGKKPGVILLSKVNLQNLSITRQTSVERLA